MGVAHLAREMYDRIIRNTGDPTDGDVKTSCAIAALLHDIGHGPFSHTLEEILKGADIDFDHEVMTQRLIEEEGSEIRDVLTCIDPAYPAQIACYIDKKRRKKEGRAEHWSYRLVSSQLDADRLDYLLRDATSAELRGGSFDLPRLLDSLQHLDGTRIAVDRGAMETVEAYLLTLDHMYRVVYYHHAIRSASVLLSAVIRRAFDLHRKGDDTVFPAAAGGRIHPLASLMGAGQSVELDQYVRLGEFQVWSLIEEWQHGTDRVLADLAGRLLRRRLFKTLDVDPTHHNELNRRTRLAKDLVIKRLNHVDEGTVAYYVSVDEPSRTSYKRYDWRSEDPDESIWMVGAGRRASPIEEDSRSKIVTALKETTYFHRLVFPEEIREELMRELNVKGRMS
jgi:hypothetical protein